MKSAARQAEARAHETKQRAYQRTESGNNGKAPAHDPSAGRGVAETAKGAVKQAAGKVTGKDELRPKARSRRSAARTRRRPRSTRRRPTAHREKADAHKETSDSSASRSSTPHATRPLRRGLVLSVT